METPSKRQRVEPKTIGVCNVKECLFSDPFVSFASETTLVNVSFSAPDTILVIVSTEDASFNRRLHVSSVLLARCSSFISNALTQATKTKQREITISGAHTGALRLFVSALFCPHNLTGAEFPNLKPLLENHEAAVCLFNLCSYWETDHISDTLLKFYIRMFSCSPTVSAEAALSNQMFLSLCPLLEHMVRDVEPKTFPACNQCPLHNLSSTLGNFAWVSSGENAANLYAILVSNMLSWFHRSHIEDLALKIGGTTMLWIITIYSTREVCHSCGPCNSPDETRTSNIPKFSDIFTLFYNFLRAEKMSSNENTLIQCIDLLWNKNTANSSREASIRILAEYINAPSCRFSLELKNTLLTRLVHANHPEARKLKKPHPLDLAI